MGKIAIFLLFLLVFTVSAQADTYEFNLGDMRDLDHYYAYSWGKKWEMPSDEHVVGASLFFNDIRNWDNNANILYVHLLDTPFMRPNATTTYRRYYDNQGGGNYFDGVDVQLNYWENLPNTAQDITYNFDSDEIISLNSFINNDSIFGLGFDPDCHYYNNGIKLAIETETAPVPESATMLLLGIGLVGLASLRKFKKA